MAARCKEQLARATAPGKGSGWEKLLAACTLQTRDGESERYEYDKARYIVFRYQDSQRERGAHCHESQSGRSRIRLCFIHYRFRTRSKRVFRREAHSTIGGKSPVAGPRSSSSRRFRPLSPPGAGRASPYPFEVVPTPKSHPVIPSTVAFISRALEYGKWINATANTSDIADTCVRKL